MLYVQISQKIAQILTDETLTFSNKNIAKTDSEARKFWKISTNNDPRKTANALSNLFDFMINNHISLHAADIRYIDRVVIGEYLEAQIWSEEAKTIKIDDSETTDKKELENNKEDEKEETIDTTNAQDEVEDHRNPSIIETLREKLSKISTKNPYKNDNEEGDLQVGFDEDKIDGLKQDISKYLKDPKNLAILEQHISQVYQEQTVAMEDYKSLARVLNDIEQCLCQSEYIFYNYGKFNINHAVIGIPKVENFGSSANTLWSFNSDIDIVIEFERDESQSKILPLKFFSEKER